MASPQREPGDWHYRGGRWRLWVPYPSAFRRHELLLEALASLLTGAVNLLLWPFRLEWDALILRTEHCLMNRVTESSQRERRGD